MARINEIIGKYAESLSHLKVNVKKNKIKGEELRKTIDACGVARGIEELKLNFEINEEIGMEGDDIMSKLEELQKLKVIDIKLRNNEED